MKHYSRWVKTTKELPETNEKFGESEYLQCVEAGTCNQFVGWYNSKMNQWFVCHYLAQNVPVNVTHFRSLYKAPKP